MLFVATVNAARAGYLKLWSAWVCACMYTFQASDAHALSCLVYHLCFASCIASIACKHNICNNWSIASLESEVVELVAGTSKQSSFSLQTEVHFEPLSPMHCFGSRAIHAMYV